MMGNWSRRYKSLCLIKAGELGMKVRRRGSRWEICKGQLLKVCERPAWAWLKRERVWDSREQAIQAMLYIVNDWAMDTVEADRPCCLVELWYSPHWFVTKSPMNPNRTFKVGVTKAEALDMVRSDEGSSKTATSPSARRRTSRAKCSDNPEGHWNLHHSFCTSH